MKKTKNKGQNSNDNEKQPQKQPKNTFQDTPSYDEFYKAVTKRGLIVCGSIGSGKTNFTKHLAKKIINDSTLNAKVNIFDTVGNWFFEFEAIPSQQISFANETIIPSNKIVYRLNMDSEESRIDFIRSVFWKQFEKQKHAFNIHKGDLSKFPAIINIVEEANTIVSSYAIRKGFLRDFIAFSRNYNIRNIFVMQRLADSSPKLTERIPNMAFGLMVGANDKRRIRDILPKRHRKESEIEKPFEFKLCFNNKVITYTTDLFKGKRTIEYKIECITTGFLSKKQTYTIKPVMDSQFATYCPKDKHLRLQFLKDFELDLDEEMDIDLGLLGEPDEDF